MTGTEQELNRAMQISAEFTARVSRVVIAIESDRSIDRTFVTPQLIAEIQSAMPALLEFYSEKPATLLLKRENNLIAEYANLWGDDHKNAHISNGFFALQTVIEMLNNNSIRRGESGFVF